MGGIITGAASLPWWPEAASSQASTTGETDDHCYNIVKDPVHINDLNASVLHCLGIDHEKFSVKQQGLDVRLTGVDGAKIIRGLLR